MKDAALANLGSFYSKHPGCKDLLKSKFTDGGSVEEMLEKASDYSFCDVAYENSRGRERSIGSLFESAEGLGETLANWMARRAPGTAQTLRDRRTGRAAPHILLYGDVSGSTIAHEVLHVYTGLGDVALANVLELQDRSGIPWSETSASVALDLFFNAGCDKSKVPELR